MEVHHALSTVELPAEILVDIFKFLPLQDFVHATVVCSGWKEVTYCTILWRNFALQRWTIGLPNIKELAYDWKAYFVERYKKDKEVTSLLKLLFAGNSKDDQRVQDESLEKLLMYGSLILDELQRIIAYNATNWTEGIGLAYYAKQVSSYIRETMILQEWRNLLEREGQKASIETGAIIIAKWEYPNLDAISEIIEPLNHLAHIVAQKLGLLLLPSELAKLCTLVSRDKIIEALLYVIYKDLKYHGNTTNYYDVKNSFLNDVLRTRVGIPISLSAVLIAVANRLGVSLEPIGFPGHFLVRYTKLDQSTIYIDPFIGRIISRDESMAMLAIRGFEFDESYFEPILPRQVFIRMLTNIYQIAKSEGNISRESSALAQIIELKPDSSAERILRAHYLVSQGRFYEARLELDKIRHLRDGYTTISKALESASNPQIKVKPRYNVPEDPKYKVGQIVVTKVTGYRGVIFGYDYKSMLNQFTFPSARGTSRGSNQPFYYLLLDGRDVSYEAEDYLSLDPYPTKRFLHNDLGKYFERFDKDTNTFVPTGSLKTIYPNL